MESRITIEKNIKTPIRIHGFEQKFYDGSLKHNHEYQNHILSTREMSLEEKKLHGKEEEFRRIISSDSFDSRSIFNEIDISRKSARQLKIEAMKLEKEKQLRRREKYKINNLITYKSTLIKAGLAIAITAGIGTMFMSQMKEATNPANIAALDMVIMSNGKILTNDAQMDAQHFDNSEEISEYVLENGIDTEDLNNAIQKVCDKYDLNAELVMNEVQEDYSNIFSSKQR